MQNYTFKDGLKMKLFYIVLLININTLHAQNIADLSTVELDTLIDQAIVQKNNELALKYVELKLIKIRTKNLHDTILADGLNDVAIFYQQLENHEKSIEIYKEVIAIYKKYFGANHLKYAESLVSFGMIYKTARLLPEAQKMYEEAILIYKKSPVRKNDKYIEWSNSLSLIYTRIGLYEKAEAQYQEILNLIQSLYGKKHNKYVYTLNFLGHLYFVKNQYSKAESIWLKALALNKELYGKNNENYTYTTNFLGNLYIYLGQYQKAEDFAIETLLLRKELFGKQHWSYAQSLNNLAVLYEKQGKYEEAESLLLEAIELRKNDKVSESKATDLNNLATLYYLMGKDNEAEIFFLESITIEKLLHREKMPNYASTITSLAGVYSRQQNYEKAEDLLLEGLAIRKALLGENSLDYAISLHQLANLYIYQKKYEEAIAYFKKAQNIIKNTVGTQHRLYAINLNSLGVLYTSIGQREKAEALYLKSNQITVENFGKKHVGYLTGLINLKRFYTKQKEYAKAFEIAKEFLALVNTSPNNDLNSIESLVEQKNPYLELTLVFLEELSLLYDAQYRAMGDVKYLQKKQEALETGIKLSNRFRIDFNTKKDKLSALKKTKRIASLALETVWELGEFSKGLDTYGTVAFNYAEQNKSMLLMDATSNQNAHRMGDLPDSLAWRENELLEKERRLKKDIAENYNEVELNKLQKEQSLLSLEINNFKQLLKDKYPKYHQLKYEDLIVTAQEIQTDLTKGEVLIEYFVADSIIYAFYLSQETISWLPLKIAQTVLDSQVAKLHKSLSDYQFITNKPDEAYQLYTETAHWFYNKIIEPIFKQQDLSAIQHLIIIADGELGNLPFEVFLTTASTDVGNYTNLSYLIKKYKISYNYSATLMHTTQSTTSSNNNGKILAMAAQYGEESKNLSAIRLPYLQSFRKVLNPLPNTKKEVEKIKTYLEGTFRTGTKATERNFKQEAGEYAILHLAMHGLLNEYTPILSSLVFTEDGDSLEDNFLQAWEIYKLKLKADLVVLSACETGYGRFEQGEGILSIARSFLYAGVPSLVVSLWSVNDASTAIIMQNFYNNLAQGKDKVTALQQAKLSYLETAKGIASHPAFWSPFIQIGNHKAVALVQKQSSKNLYYILVAAIGFLGLGIWLRKRRKVVH